MSEADRAMAQERGGGSLRRRWWLLLLAGPFLLLWPSLVGNRTFLPYDLAQFPPASVQRTPDELTAMQRESNFDVTETPIWFVPELRRARDTMLREGALPGWNPTARTGTALLPHGHDGLWYPPVWLLLLAGDPADALGWLAFLNLTIAAALMFGFLRALPLALPAAALGALAFSLSSTLCANAHNYPRLSSLVWLPGMFWGLRVAADSHGARRVRALCGFAVCFALSWVAGFPPYALPAAMLAGLFGLTLWLQSLRSAPRREGVQRLLGLGAAAALGVLLCCHYLLPAAAFFSQSARPLDPDLARISQVSFEDYGFLQYLAPDLFGRPDRIADVPYANSPLPLLLGNLTQRTKDEDRPPGVTGDKPLRPGFNSTEYAVFSGSLVLWFALLGLGQRTVRHRWLPWLLLLLCWGMATFRWPLAELFLLPGVRVVPPLRFLGPCCFLVAWLAAQGLHASLRQPVLLRLGIGATLAMLTAVAAAMFAFRLAEPDIWQQWHLAEHLAQRFGPWGENITPERIEQLVMRGNGIDYAKNGADLAASSCRSAAMWHAAAAMLLLAWLWMSLLRAAASAPPTLAIVAIVFTGAELLLAGKTFDGGIRREHVEWTPVHDFLVEARRAAADRGGFMVARAAPLAGDALPPPMQLPPGTLGPHDIRDLQVYTYFDGRSLLPLAALLRTVLKPETAEAATAKGYLTTCLPDDARVLQHPLLDLLGVRYVLATTPLQHAGARVGPEWRGPGGEFFVYERASALPRAFVVGELRVHDDTKEIQDGVEHVVTADAQVVAALADPALQPRAVAHATRADVALYGEALPRPDAAAAARTVRFRRDDATALELEVTAGAAGWLLLTDTWLPGWTARIDGNDVPLLRADHAMRAVALPPAACTVAFCYTPPGLQLGAWLAGGAALVLLAVLGFCRPSRLAGRRVETPM